MVEAYLDLSGRLLVPLPVLPCLRHLLRALGVLGVPAGVGVARTLHRLKNLHNRADLIRLKRLG